MTVPKTWIFFFLNYRVVDLLVHFGHCVVVALYSWDSKAAPNHNPSTTLSVLELVDSTVLKFTNTELCVLNRKMDFFVICPQNNLRSHCKPETHENASFH